MSANLFGSRFFGHRKPAWHGLGVVSDKDMTAVEAMSAIGGYWIEQRPVTVMLNNEQTETGDYAIVRSQTFDDNQEMVFGYTTEHYKIIQPLRICELFDENVSQPVETLGMLQQGQKLFLTWGLEPFNVGKNDEVKPYGFIAGGFDGKYGSSLNVVVTRVVCENTWRSAIQEAEATKEKGRGRIWSGKHTSGNLDRDFGIWLSYVQQESEKRNQSLSQVFNMLAAKEIHSKETAQQIVDGIFAYPDNVPDYFPEKLRVEKQEKIDALKESADKNRQGVMALFDGEGTAIDATAWGLFNAVTEWENWGLASKKPTEYSVLFGNRDMVMSKAYSVITENLL